MPRAEAAGLGWQRPASCRLPTDMGTGAGTGMPLQRGNGGGGGGGHHPAGRGAAADSAPAPGDAAVGAWESGACRREPLPPGVPPRQHPGPRHPPAAALSLPWARGLGLWDWCAPQGKLRAAQAGDGSSHGTQPCHPALPPARPAPPAPSRSHRDKLEPGSLQVLGGSRVGAPRQTGHQGRVPPAHLKVRARSTAGPWERGREGTPSPFPVYLGRRCFLRPFVCKAAATRAPPGFPVCRRARRRGMNARAALTPWDHRPGTPHRAQTTAEEARCPQGGPVGSSVHPPAAHAGCARGAHGVMHTWDAHTGCRCRVLAGGGASQLPGARPSWVLRYGCRSCGARRSRYCGGHSPAQPLKSGDFLPQFYGPICLRRALPPAINHSALGGSGEHGAAGRMPTALALARGTSQTHVCLGQEKDPSLCPMALPGWHRDTHYGMAAGPCSSD